MCKAKTKMRTSEKVWIRENGGWWGCWKDNNSQGPPLWLLFPRAKAVHVSLPRNTDERPRLTAMASTRFEIVYPFGRSAGALINGAAAMQRSHVATASQAWAAVSLIQCRAALQSPDIQQQRGRGKQFPWQQLAMMSTLITSHTWHSEHLGNISSRTKTNRFNTRCRHFLPFCGSSWADAHERRHVSANFSAHLVELLTGLQFYVQGTLFDTCYC